jgi:hypothetical protein
MQPQPPRSPSSEEAETSTPTAPSSPHVMKQDGFPPPMGARPPSAGAAYSSRWPLYQGPRGQARGRSWGYNAGWCRVGGRPLGEAGEGETAVIVTDRAAIAVWVGAVPVGEGYRGAIVVDGDVAQVRILALTRPFEEVASGEGYAVLGELEVRSFALGF